MPVDWDKFQETIDEEVDAAAKKTNEKLASAASSVSRLTDEEVKKLFPKPADVQKLKDLLEIVKSEDSHNQKVSKLMNNIEDLAGTVVKLVSHFA